MLKTVRSTVNVDQITGVLPVVNGGTGVTTSTGTGSVVLSAAPTLSGNVGLSTGNLVPATAAKGINFTANTPAAGMTSQLLNWYEEGTYTITISGSTSGSGTVPATATYTRIGRQVTVNVVIQNKTFPTYSGTLQISLPFTSSTLSYGSMVYFYDVTNWSTGATFAGWQAVAINGTAFANLNRLQVNGDRQTSATSANTITSGTSGLYLSFVLTYFV